MTNYLFGNLQYCSLVTLFADDKSLKAVVDTWFEGQEEFLFQEINILQETIIKNDTVWKFVVIFYREVAKLFERPSYTDNTCWQRRCCVSWETVSACDADLAMSFRAHKPEWPAGTSTSPFPQIAWSAWTLLSSNNCKSRVLSTTRWSCWLLIVDGLMPVHTTVLMARVHGWCFWHPRTQAVNTGSVDRRPCSWRWCTSALNTVRVYGCQKRRPWNARDGTNGMFTLNRLTRS